MARSFDQVLAEVTAKSDPQRKVVLDQVAALPGQQAADESGLEAKKTQAFDDILGGARRRGLGFAGIPLGEQAKYTATDYAPALANMKAGYNTRKGTLESALADIGRNDYTTSNDIFGQERSFEEQRRQFDLDYKLRQEQAAAAQRAAASTFSPSLGRQAPAGNTQASAGPKAPAAMQGLYNEVFVNPKGGTWDDRSLVNDYNATFKSAGYGNPRDRQKLELYHLMRPDLFGDSVPGRVLSNNVSF